ncbi:hypothetical protein M9H77_29777 [Catharanthus roseus]|uniref:Uncharacterized protein n=1 Tax=Catharanthus roseus TaxID=4058 RepID=A0ACB9ZWF9_CATRO|nr:hypothetical protein M9H77_29777 [Catharanthus roseus]
MDKVMVVYMENAFKIKLEDFKNQGKASKLLSICTRRITQRSKLDVKMANPAPIVASRPLDENGSEAKTLPRPVSSTVPSPLGFGLILLERFDWVNPRVPNFITIPNSMIITSV